MEDESPGPPLTQLTMAGMPLPVRTAPVNLYDVSPGQVVKYLGKVAGGPRYGDRGLVKETLARRAVVDMGRSGTWRIPYHFLAALPRAA